MLNLNSTNALSITQLHREDTLNKEEIKEENDNEMIVCRSKSMNASWSEGDTSDWDSNVLCNQALVQAKKIFSKFYILNGVVFQIL